MTGFKQKSFDPRGTKERVRIQGDHFLVEIEQDRPSPGMRARLRCLPALRAKIAFTYLIAAGTI